MPAARILVGAGLVLAAAAAVWLLATQPSPASLQQRPGQRVDANQLGQPDRTARAVDSSAERASVIRIRRDLRLAIRDKLTGTPLPSATVTLIDTEDPPPTLVQAASARADAEGLVALEAIPDPRAIAIVRAPGHVPKALRGIADASEAEEPAEVHLDRSGLVRVAFVDSYGRPIEDALAILETNARDRFSYSATRLPSGIGHPLAASPVWVAEADVSGVARIDEVPPGRFFLTVWHPMMMPVSSLGVGSTMEIPVGETAVTVVLRQPYGVVFSCPVRSKVRSLSWSVKKLSLDRSLQVLTRLGAARQWLQQRFPDDFVYVHVPSNPDRELMVRCSVTVEDGTFWTGVWPLTPIESITAPVFLEQMGKSGREMTIRIRDAAGTEFAGIPLGLEEENGFRLSVVSGEPFLVPFGQYRVYLRNLSAVLYLAFENLTMKVGAETPPDFLVSVPHRLIEVIVEPQLPTPEPLGPLIIDLSTDEGGGPTVANWRPSRGPVRKLLKGKSVTVKIRSTPYEDVDLGPVQANPPEPLVLRVPLKQRRR